MSPTPAIDRRLRNLALLVAACFFMENLDGTIVLTAAPRIGRALDVPATSVSLVIAAYLVTLAVLIPLSGWLVARWGARPVFLAAIAIFTAASLGCALSSAFAELVAFRVAQGAGGAMMVPVGRLVMLSQTEKSDLLRVTSLLVWPALIAPVVAPLAGGLLTTYASWRWLFAVNLPLGVLAWGVAWRLIEAGRPATPPPLDLPGVLLTCAGLAAATYTAQLLSEPVVDWTFAALLGAAAVVLLTAAAHHLLRAAYPLVNLRTLQVTTFRTAIGSGSLFWCNVAAIPFLLTLLFQTVFGWSPVKSGALVLFVFVGNIAIKPATTPLLRRFGFRPVLVAATQQLSVGLGVPVAAVAVRAGRPLAALLGRRPSPGGAYTVAFALMAAVVLVATAAALRLHPVGGFTASLHRESRDGVIIIDARMFESAAIAHNSRVQRPRSQR